MPLFSGLEVYLGFAVFVHRILGVAFAFGVRLVQLRFSYCHDHGSPASPRGLSLVGFRRGLTAFHPV